MYDFNASELTDAFEPADLDRIVRCYVRAKGLLDALRGWEAASNIDYPAEEDRLAAVGWAIDRLRQAHREMYRRLPDVLMTLGAGAGGAGPEGAALAAAPRR